ncbi:hypothetical protein [Aquimarina algicola]|uniref:Uncharacterized protein n=1 Tax=Aquimarina algicola TaxID=2589995 RepID=A0A504JA78_9FLAO|nr:hypothetical protein [Aquimarina algicola]TPN87846.1 hypothetical protein FHK87_09745 [Aquimarina algicola]
MKSEVFKQQKPLKAKILSVIVAVFSVLILLVSTGSIIPRILFFCVSMVVLGYSISYEIKENFLNRKHFSVFGVKIFSTALKLEYPDYISVFSTSSSINNEWGAIAAIGTKERHDNIVVRFFTDNRNFTLYRTNNYEEAFRKATTLQKILNIELYDNTKE